jgi:hypothetical protein
MNYSQLEDERLLLYFEALRKQFIWTGTAAIALRGMAPVRMRTSFVNKWICGGLMHAHRRPSA